MAFFLDRRTESGKSVSESVSRMAQKENLVRIRSIQRAKRFAAHRSHKKECNFKDLDHPSLSIK